MALRHIGRALQLGGFLSEIHLERSSVGGTGLAHLVSGARSSATLKRIHLSSCRLGPSDGTHLGILLRQSKVLETLDVEDNYLQDSGCMQILSGLAANRESKLMDLRLGTNQLTAQVANAIAIALASAPIRVLSLSKNNIGTEGVLIMRDGMLRCQLQHLDLSETRLSCEAAIAIAEIAVESRTLESLDLRGNTIRTAGIMALCLATRINRRLISVEVDRVSPPTKGGGDNTLLVEELVSLTSEMDQQLIKNREVLSMHSYDADQPADAIEGEVIFSDSEGEHSDLEHPNDQPTKAADPVDVFFNHGKSLEELSGSDGEDTQPIDESVNQTTKPDLLEAMESGNSNVPHSGASAESEDISPVMQNVLDVETEPVPEVITDEDVEETEDSAVSEIANTELVTDEADGSAVCDETDEHFVNTGDTNFISDADVVPTDSKDTDINTSVDDSEDSVTTPNCEVETSTEECHDFPVCSNDERDSAKEEPLLSTQTDDTEDNSPHLEGNSEVNASPIVENAGDNQEDSS